VTNGRVEIFTSVQRRPAAVERFGEAATGGSIAWSRERAFRHWRGTRGSTPAGGTAGGATVRTAVDELCADTERARRACRPGRPRWPCTA